MDKQLIITKAKEFIGTPYEHQGRVKGVGIDCCGLVIGVAHELGLSDYNIDGYSRYADGVDLLREFSEQCVPVDHYEPGDILIFRIRSVPQHCGIVGDLNGGLSLIHAYATIGKCVEHTLDKTWQERIIKAYAYCEKNPSTRDF